MELCDEIDKSITKFGHLLGEGNALCHRIERELLGLNQLELLTLSKTKYKINRYDQQDADKNLGKRLIKMKAKLNQVNKDECGKSLETSVIQEFEEPMKYKKIFQTSLEIKRK